MAARAIQGVIFDLGGVVVRSPIEGIAQYEREHDVPEGFVNANISSRTSDGAFQQLERGELPLAAFFGAFEAELCSAEAMAAYAALRAKRRQRAMTSAEMAAAAAAVRRVDARKLFAMMGAASTLPNFTVLSVLLHQLRAVRPPLLLGALTNNIKGGFGGDGSGDDGGPRNAAVAARAATIARRFAALVAAAARGAGHDPNPKRDHGRFEAHQHGHPSDQARMNHRLLINSVKKQPSGSIHAVFRRGTGKNSSSSVRRPEKRYTE